LRVRKDDLKMLWVNSLVLRFSSIAGEETSRMAAIVVPMMANMIEIFETLLNPDDVLLHIHITTNQRTNTPACKAVVVSENPPFMKAIRIIRLKLSMEDRVRGL
jgi:hypothetical protein